jgi:integrase/recombinase XerD
MIQDIQDFIQYLHSEKQTSANTEVSYERDLKKMGRYLRDRGVNCAEEVNSAMLDSYVVFLEKEGRKPATISRSIAAMKAFFHYLEQEKHLEVNPAGQLKAPHIEKKMPVVLTTDEVSRLLEQPGDGSAKAMRDKAMLELMYATGMRVSEVISLRVSDVDLQRKCITCADEHRQRVIPFGTVAQKALQRYLLEGRSQLMRENDVDWLFLNCSGDTMSRQGFWKLIKTYGKKAGIQQEITPHMLRHSFAAHLISDGTDLKAVQEIMGYSDVSTTQIYVQLNRTREASEVMEAIEA